MRFSLSSSHCFLLLSILSHVSSFSSSSSSPIKVPMMGPSISQKSALFLSFFRFFGSSKMMVCTGGGGGRKGCEVVETATGTDQNHPSLASCLYSLPLLPLFSGVSGPLAFLTVVLVPPSKNKCYSLCSFSFSPLLFFLSFPLPAPAFFLASIAREKSRGG